MLVHPQFDPVAFAIGPVQIRWYGLMYLAAFAAFLLLARRRTRQTEWQAAGWTARDVEDLLFFGVLGVVIGGRLGYVLFYESGKYLANPLHIFQVWKGGMAFHGGLLGVLAALAWFARSRKRSFLEVGDFVAPCVPLGIAAVRLGGNFVNGELWGRAADASLPWAMRFPQSGTDIARHPSQIYQGLTEGLLLFLALWFFSRRERPLGRVSGLFLLGYGGMRFCTEFFREPDRQLGYLALGLTMGQWLCVPMVAAGLWLLLRRADRLPARAIATAGA
jgi:phosphatidylglycerol---prolipoprotein diacylglyceryl transferase